jgi:hypothetical protein
LPRSFDGVFYGAAGTSTGDTVDDEFNLVSFLSHFDGANNGVNNAFDDSSASNHTVTRKGDAQQGSFGPFAREEGYWGVNFDGSDGLSSPASTDYEFGTSDITVEYWAFPTTSGAISNILDNRQEADGWKLGRDASNRFQVYNEVTSSYLFESGTFPQGAWSHFCWTRASGVNKFFINGVQSGSNVSDNSNFDSNSLNIGVQRSGGSQFFTGTISGVRVIKGTAVEPSGIPTSPATAVTNTKLLTCQSNRFVDNSTSAHALTTIGNPSVSAFGPFLTDAAYDAAVNGASVFLDGNGDYLTIPDSSDFTLGNTFTLEAWIYPQVLNSYNTVIEQNGSSGFYYSALSNGTMQFYAGSGGSGQADSDAALILNQWNHVAFAVSSGTGYHYINGARSGSSDTSIDIGNISAALQIGQQGGSYPFTGYMCDVRIIKGTALYSGTTYTVPTAPLTAITNTKLLLNMADGQAIDSAAQKTLVLEGNSKTSTAQAKFGDASIAFDEVNDYAIIKPHDSFQPFGTGNFTIECFARFATDPNGNGQGLFGLSSGYLNSASRGPAVGTNNSNGRWAIYYGTTNLVHGSLVPAINTWYHVAYVRNSGVTKLYIDGTEILSVSDTTDYTDQYFVFGGWYSTAYLLNGFIDEFRISHMARYTSNFTAPSAPFPDKGQ